MTCHAIYWQKARINSKGIDGSARLTSGCVFQWVKDAFRWNKSLRSIFVLACIVKCALYWSSCDIHVLYICSVDIPGVPGGNVNILGGHSIGHSKQTSVYVRVILQTVSEVELLHCAGVWHPLSSFTPAIPRHFMKHVNRCGASVGRCNCW
jgi:hypothetical protein